MRYVCDLCGLRTPDLEPRVVRGAVGWWVPDCCGRCRRKVDARQAVVKEATR